MSPLTLSPAEQAALRDLARSPHTSPSLRVRSQIILGCAAGRSNKDVAEETGVAPATVGKWRRRFVRMGMAGLDDGLRSGRPRMLDRARVDAAVSSLATAPTPILPSTRAVATDLGVSQSTVARALNEERPYRRLATPAPPRVASRVRPPAAPELLSDKVYDVVKGWILSGEMAPGTRVVESEIARVLGTSQTPAREAVRRLAQEGLVTHRPRLGNFVAAISQAEAREAREVRVLIETAAARRAAGHVAAADLARLRAEVDRMHQAAAHRDVAAFRQADLRFHRGVCAASGNSMLLRVWSTLEPALWNLQVVSSAMFSGDWSKMARHHGALVDALAGNDPEEAARLFSAHARGESSGTRPARRRPGAVRVG